MSDKPTENDTSKLTKINDESCKTNNKNAVKKSVTSIAKRRWKILSKALCHHVIDEFETENTMPIHSTKINHANFTAPDDYAASVRRFTRFSLFQRNPFILRSSNDNNAIQPSGNWFIYRTTVNDQEYSLVIRQINQKFTPEELIGFNNTGNICVWPSEEALAYYVLHHLSAFHQRRVLELGGGMTCLAGLFLAKYTQAKFVHLTDGNNLSVQNANEILSQNMINTTGRVLAKMQFRVLCSPLKWENVNQVTDDAQYDFIISADCLFFDSARSSFVNALWQFMKPTGFGLIMAPCRGDTLNIFLQQAKQRGFNCHVRKCYNRIIWQKHLELLETSVYDEDIHYPVLIEVTKPHHSHHRVPIIPFI